MKEALIEDDEFSLSTTKDIKYNSKDVRIIFNINSFMLHKFEGNLPLIYSKSQNFNITEDTKIITLNFKIGSFNIQHLFLEIHKQGIIAIKFQINYNDLKCEVDKKDIDIFSRDIEDLELAYLDASGNFDYFKFAGKINIAYQNINKVNVHFNIVNLMNANVELNAFMNFETNVTNLDRIKT